MIGRRSPNAVILLIALASPAAVAESVPNAPAGTPAASLAERWAKRAMGGDAVSGCPHAESLPAMMNEALDRFCADAEDPAARRAEIIDRLVRSPMCYSASTPEEYDEIIRRTALLPAALLGRPEGERFGSTGTVWLGEGNANGASGRAARANLTYSFPADGALWGAGGDTAPNDLNLRLNAFFGVANRDRAYELIRQTYAAFRRSGGLTYTQVADDNSAFSFGTSRTPARGDIRVGSVVIGGGANGILAYNFFPDGGGDMTLNSAYMGSYANPNNNYRFLRNVVAHEHGHGLAYFHVIPCNGQKLMEPFINTNFDAVQIDEIRGVQRNYGDRFAGNNAANLATDFGSLTSPAVKSIIERDLSTNGAAGANNTDEDWFKFTIGSNQNIVITASPTGGSYQSTVNTNNGDCAGTPTTVNAAQAGNLNIELRNSTGATVIQTASSAATGVAEVLTRNNTAAGTYTVRVFDVGPNPAANQVVQTYDLTIRVGTSKAPPQAIAGVNKRIGSGFPCWFRGDLNSRATEPGAAINTYQWDFDDNGTFDATGPEVSTTYPTPGPRTVRLRVTDSNGLTDDDTIIVDVFDATPPPPPSAPSLLSPANGAVITDTINPTFDWTDSSDTDFYTLVVDDDPAFGSPLFTVQSVQSEVFTAPGTFTEDVSYHWKVTAQSSFGSTPALQPSFSFRIDTTPPPACEADFNTDGQRNILDLTFFLARFGTAQAPNTNGDLDGNGTVNTVDLIQFLSFFGVPCP